MKRAQTRKQKPDALLVADIHLTDSSPISRVDDYFQAQSNKLLFLKSLQEKYQCSVIDAGDIFNHWKASPWLLSRAYHLLPDNMITIPGNHDLPEHSISLYPKSGLAVLDAIGKLIVLLNETSVSSNAHLSIYGVPYGGDQGIQKEEISPGTRKILILHEMVWPGKTPPWPGAEGVPAIQVLQRFHTSFDLILTGHNHTAFTERYKGSILVNPGSMMRISADKARYAPRCYLYFADNNEVEPVYYPIQKDVHDDQHLIEPKTRDARLSAYIERMNMQWESGLSFQGNLEQFFRKNKTPKMIRELIYQAIETM